MSADGAKGGQSKSFLVAQKVFNPRKSVFIPLDKTKSRDQPLRFQENSSGIKACKQFVPQKWRTQVCANCFFYENLHHSSLPPKTPPPPVPTSQPVVAEVKEPAKQPEEKPAEEARERKESLSAGNRKSVVKEEDPISKAEVFEMVDVLGFGHSGSVYYAKKMHTKEFYAIKFFEGPPQQDEAQKEDFKAIINNINVMQENTACPFLVEYNGCYIKDNGAFMVMEHCFSSVGDILTAYPDFKFSEEQIASIFYSVFRGLSFLHKFGVIHRNIKPANILFKSDGSVKVADFGISQNITKSREKLENLANSPYWVAPEFISTDNYGNNIDIWSCGIVALAMAQHDPPNHDLPPMEVLLKIQQDDAPTITNPSNFSSNFVDFLNCCLQKDPTLRKSADQLLEHPFILSARESSEIITPLIEKLPDLQSRKRKRLTQRYEIDYESYKGTVLTVDTVNYTASLYQRDDRIVKWIEAASKKSMKRPTYGGNTLNASGTLKESSATPEENTETAEVEENASETSPVSSPQKEENVEENTEGEKETKSEDSAKRDSYYRAHGMKSRPRASDMSKKLSGFRKATLTSTTAEESKSIIESIPPNASEEEPSKSPETQKTMQKSVSDGQKPSWPKSRPSNWNAALPSGYKEVPKEAGNSALPVQTQPKPTQQSPSHSSLPITSSDDGIGLPGDKPSGSTGNSQSGTWGSLRGKLGMAIPAFERPSLMGMFSSSEKQANAAVSLPSTNNNTRPAPKQERDLFGFLKNPFNSLRGNHATALPMGGSSKPSRFFSVPLEESIALCEIEGEEHICYTMIEFLTNNALDIEGIFRISGDQIKVNELKRKYKEGEEVNLNDYSVHVICGILKLYFRELPDPLLTTSAYNDFIEAAKIKEEGRKIQKITETIETLPAPNQIMLNRLLSFLYDASQHAEQSKMTASNLSRCFAPNLLSGGKDEDPGMMLLNFSHVNGIVETMIAHQEKIFRIK